MGEYRKKPVVVEAMQLIDRKQSVIDCLDFVFALRMDPSQIDSSATMKKIREERGFVIRTLEGDMKVSYGDYIIKGVNGEFYPCKPDIFEKTYEKVEEPTPTDTFESLTRPIMKWLTETYDPHHRVIISSEVAVVTQDIKGFQTEDYIVD